MHVDRQKIITILKENGLGKVNNQMMDGIIYTYRPNMQLWLIYEEIVANPVPFLTYLVDFLEWKKQRENQSTFV